ncbi:hypothetical protein [Bifidobacterium sp. ESL0704]|uniref:hypothetical protein n=1 Tax=Bifidobacterium sp. ESL0704 TaxID=2983219 RepID=UPI0023F84D53|nr:hypothetical protein [Bifidobacterium sp. ESL0704]WEV53617.1 hypothetical protein OZX64_03920 [Bifidobacterium sp. ESL0704]
MVVFSVLGLFWYDHGNFRAGLTDWRMWSYVISLNVIMTLIHLFSDIREIRKSNRASTERAAELKAQIAAKQADIK